jgi:hypothetical protein
MCLARQLLIVKWQVIPEAWNYTVFWTSTLDMRSNVQFMTQEITASESGRLFHFHASNNYDKRERW